MPIGGWGRGGGSRLWLGPLKRAEKTSSTRGHFDPHLVLLMKVVMQ